MSLLHRRAAQLLTRGDSEREDCLSLFNPFSGSCLLAKRGAPVAGWQISGNRRPLPVLSLSTPTPPWSSPAPSLPLSRQRTLRSQRATNQHWGAFYINDKVWARGRREGGGEGGAPQSRLPAVVKAELGRGAPTSAAA